MTRHLAPALRLMLLLTLLLGVVYPVVLTGLCQWWFPWQANGSLLDRNGQVVGSTLIGQVFTSPEYFHGRPSSAGAGYDGSASGASNLGPTSAQLLGGEVEDGKVVFDGIRLRVLRYCLENGIGFTSSQPLNRFRRGDGTLDAVQLIAAFREPDAGDARRSRAEPRASQWHALIITPAQPLPADAVTGSGSGLDPDISPANARLQAPRVARARGVAVAQIERLIARYTQAPAFGLLGDARVNVLALNLALDRQAGPGASP